MSWNEGRTRSIAKLVTFTPGEWARVQRLHRQLTEGSVEYRSFGNYARKMLSEREITVTIARPLTDPMPIAKAINKVGVNVNQIASWANKNERITPEQVEQILASFDQIRALVGDLWDERRSHEAH